MAKMSEIIGINPYSVMFNTTAFTRYLENGGDANKVLKMYLQVNVICIYLIHSSIFLYPVAFILFLIQFHPVALLIVYPLVYYFAPAQPLIYYAIQGYNVMAIKQLVDHNVDLRKKNLYHMRYYTPLEFIQSFFASGCIALCHSSELNELLTPKEPEAV